MFLMLTRWSGGVYGLGLGLIALSACTQPPDDQRSGVVFSPALAAVLTIDATALTEPQFVVRDSNSGFLLGWLPTNLEQTVTLEPGTYNFETFGGRFHFSVDTAGFFQISDELTGFVSLGDEGRKLVVRGYEFTFDATTLSEPEFAFFGTNGLGAGWSSDLAPTEDVRTETLLPGGTYYFMTYGGSVPFQLEGNGQFTNLSDCPTCFEVNASNVTVHGFLFTFDSATLTEPDFSLFGTNGRLANWSSTILPTTSVQTFRLLPGGTYYFMTYGGSVPFQLEGNGQFTNLSDCPTCFEVNASNVTVHGFLFTFDSAALTEPDFSLLGTNGRRAGWSSPILPTTSVQTFRLLPGGAYSFRTAGGMVDFRPSMAGVFEDLSGCPGCWDISGLSVRMRGFTFQIQGNVLFETEFYIHGHVRSAASTPWLPSCDTHSVTLLPGNYSLRTHSLVQVFSVTLGGVLVPTPTPAAWLSVDPSGTQLTLLGHPVALEGTWAGESTFSLLGVPHSPAHLGSFSTGQPYCLNLTPGAYAFRNNGGIELAQMVIANDGTITIDNQGLSATLQGALCANPRCQTNQSPHADAVVQTGDNSAPEGSTICLSGEASSDPDSGDVLSYAWAQTSGSPTVVLSSPGSSVTCFTAPDVDIGGTSLTFQLTVCDTAMACDSASVTVSIEDVAVNEPPNCEAASVNASIWPPNHKLVPVTIAGVSDPEGTPLIISVIGIFQDELLNGLGDGDTAPDAAVIGGVPHIRAERAGTSKSPGNGRVYHITFTASDSQGGTCSGVGSICVPHDQNPNRPCIDDGPLYDSFN